MDQLPFILFKGDLMRWVAILVMFDWLSGVVGAIATKTFKPGFVAHYLRDGVLPYVFVFAVVQILGLAQPDLAFIVPVSFVLIVITLVSNIIGNLGKLGLPCPKVFKKD